MGMNNYCIPSEQIKLCNLLKSYNNYTELIIRFTDHGKVEACNLCVEVDYDKLGVYNIITFITILTVYFI